MELLEQIVQNDPNDYKGQSIQDADSNQLIIGANGVVFKCGGHEVILRCTPPSNYAELEACVESLQYKARKDKADVTLQNALKAWWEKLTA